MALAILLTLAFRPVGAFIFGLLADRYGRRLPLMLDLVFYSIVEVATGFARDFTTFLVLRALFGIGMGGEWGVGASLAMEKIPVKWRGVLSGLLQQGYSLGSLLAALCYLFLFNKWGWRPMFFLGGLPALLAIFVRLRVKESEVWQRSKRANWSQLGRSIAAHWRLFFYIAFLMTAMNLASHGTQDMYPTFLQRFWKLDATQTLAHFRRLYGGRNHWRHPHRTLVRPLWPPPRHDRRFTGRNRPYSALGRMLRGSVCCTSAHFSCSSAYRALGALFPHI